MSYNPNDYLSTLKKTSVPIEIAHPHIQNAYMKYLKEPTEQAEHNIGETAQYLEEYHNEKPLQTFTRNVENVGKRAIEGAKGNLGSAVNLATMGISNFLNYLVGEEGAERSNLPSTRDYREMEREKTGIKHEPRSKWEEVLQESAGDVGEYGSTFAVSQAFPFLRGVGGIFSNVILPTIAGTGSKHIAKGLGATEKEADNIKLAAAFFTSFAGNTQGARISRQAMDAATQAVPQTVMANNPSIRRVAHDIMNRDWYRTMRGPEKNRAMDFIQELYDRSVQGNLTMRDVIQYRKDLNMARQQMGAFRPFHEMTSGQRAVARRHLNEVDEVLNSAIEHYGRQNPQWLRQYRLANQAFAVTSGSQYLSDVIHRSPVLKNVQSDLTRTLFMGGSGGMGGVVGAALPAAGAVATGVASMSILNRVLRSPILRRHYTQVLTQASLGNAEKLDAAIMSFDKAAQKEMSKNSNQQKKDDKHKSSK